jgi:hypothetical protein
MRRVINPAWPPRRRPARHVAEGLLALLLAAVGAGAPAAQDGGGAAAHFVVRAAQAGPPLGAFAATLGPFGNGADMIRGGSFEPTVWRDWFLATEDAPNRVVASPSDISGRYLFASGAFDGADVEILRIENGRFRRVRSARIPPGGFHASGWTDALPRDRMIDGHARRHVYSFDAHDRPGVPYRFTLRGIDAEGRMSPRASAVSVVAPADRAERGGRRRAAEAAAEPGAQAGTAPPTRAPRGRQARAAAAPELDGQGLRRRPDLSGEAAGAAPVLRAALTPEGKVALSWTADDRWAGFLLERSDTDPAEHRGYWFALEDGRPGEPVKAGDLVIISKRFPGISRGADLANRAWGTRLPVDFRPRTVDFFPGEEPGRDWALRPHPQGSPVPEGGETYLEMMLAEGAEARLGMVTHGGVEQDFYQVLEPGRPYVIEVWLRADRPVEATLRLSGFYEDRVPPFAPLRVGPQWQRHAVTFTPDTVHTGRRRSGFSLDLRGPARIDVDNLRMYRADHPFLAMDDAEVARLRAGAMGALRTHGLVKTKTQSYDLARLLDAGSGADSLPRYLATVARSGADLWLQVEPHLTAADWLGLVEYLAAPWDPARDSARTRPWAALRVAQGRQAPWTDAFRHIFVEIGNETWNVNMAPWVFQPMRDAATGRNHSRGSVYGMWHQYVWDILRSSPHWQTAGMDAKVTGVIGGHGPVANYGGDAAEASPAVASNGIVAVNAYIMGWEAGAHLPEESPEGYLALLTHVLQVGRPQAEAQVARMQAIARSTGGSAPRLGTYESGPGYLMDNFKGRSFTDAQLAAQERVMKSVAAGTATLDSFLMRASLGFELQNFFTFGAGPRWTSHSIPAQGSVAHPPWMLLSLFNREATGAMLPVETLRVPTANLASYDRRSRPVEDAPLAAVYATRQGDRLAVFVVSRRVPGLFGPGDDGRTAVRVDLPVAGAARLRHIALSGDLAAHNLAGEAVRPVETVRPVPAAAGRLDVPDLAPGTVQLFVYDGVRWKG